MQLEHALTQIKADDAKKEAFYKDPQGVLEKMGVDTTNLKFSKTPEGSNQALQGSNQALGWQWCASIGYIGCASVGSN